jgi:hypothetical protein
MLFFDVNLVTAFYLPDSVRFRTSRPKAIWKLAHGWFTRRSTNGQPNIFGVKLSEYASL